MILKTFLKIKKDGTPVIKGSNYKNKYYESDDIRIDLPENKSSIVKFEVVFSNEEWTDGTLDLDYYGFELTNANGELVERVITKKNL